MEISVKFDIDQARQAFRWMQNEVNKAAAVSLKRVATTARKTANATIRERLALRSSTVRENLAIKRPYGNRELVVSIVASGKPVPLRDYQARQTAAGVTYRVLKIGPRKLYQAAGRRGFIVKRFGGHVFVRVGVDPPGPRRARIRSVFGPSIPQYFVTRVVTDRLERVVSERWPIEFSRELKYRLNREGGSAG